MKDLITAIDAARSAVPTTGDVATTFNGQIDGLTYNLDRCREAAVNVALLSGELGGDDPLRYPASLAGTRSEAMAANLGHVVDEPEAAPVVEVSTSPGPDAITSGGEPVVAQDVPVADVAPAEGQ